MGERVLHRVQYGLETAHGDCAAADTRLLGEVVLPTFDREVIIPGFGLGMRVPGVVDNAFVRRVLAEGVTFRTPSDRGGAYYQVFPMLMNILLHNETPTEQTSGQGDYCWTWNPPLTAVETIDSVALECGDDTRAYQLCYVQSPQLVIAGNTDTGEVTAEARLYARDITPAKAATAFTGFSAVATIPAATYVIGKFFRLYVDDTAAALGTNELEDTLVDFRLTITGGASPKLRGSTDREFDLHGQGENMCTLELGLERGGADAEAEEWYAFSDLVTPRYVRLEIDSGIAIGAGVNHSMRFDLAGVWTAWQSFGSELRGNALDRVTLTMGYGRTWTKAGEFRVCTNVAAI